MTKKKTEAEQLAEPRVTADAFGDRVKVNVAHPDDPKADYEYEVTGEQCCEYLSQMFAVRGVLTPRMHNLIGSIKNELATPFHAQ